MTSSVCSFTTNIANLFISPWKICHYPQGDHIAPFYPNTHKSGIDTKTIIVLIFIY